MNIYRRYQDAEAPRPRQTAPKKLEKHSTASLDQIAKPSSDFAPVDFKPKRGRPRIEERGKTLSDLKPWQALGMCRRSWEKRQKEERLKNARL